MYTGDLYTIRNQLPSALVRGRRAEITEELTKQLIDGEDEPLIIEKSSEGEKETGYSIFLKQYLRAVLFGGVLAGILCIGMKKNRKIQRKRT